MSSRKVLTLNFFLRNFGESLSDFQNTWIPELIALLHKNAVANPEKLLLELVEDQIS